MSSRSRASGRLPDHPDRGTCPGTGKVKLLAHEAARFAQAMRRRRSHERLTPYACRSCGYHHVGHTTTAARRLNRRAA